MLQTRIASRRDHPVGVSSDLIVKLERLCHCFRRTSSGTTISDCTHPVGVSMSRLAVNLDVESPCGQAPRLA